MQNSVNTTWPIVVDNEISCEITDLLTPLETLSDCY